MLFGRCFVRRLMIVGDHDRRTHSPSNNSLVAVLESEVDIEANFLTMMSAVASDPQWKYDGSAREIHGVRAIELHDF